MVEHTLTSRPVSFSVLRTVLGNLTYGRGHKNDVIAIGSLEVLQVVQMGSVELFDHLYISIRNRQNE